MFNFHIIQITHATLSTNHTILRELPFKALTIDKKPTLHQPLCRPRYTANEDVENPSYLFFTFEEEPFGSILKEKLEVLDQEDHIYIYIDALLIK